MANKLRWLYILFIQTIMWRIEELCSACGCFCGSGPLVMILWFTDHHFKFTCYSSPNPSKKFTFWREYLPIFPSIRWRPSTTTTTGRRPSAPLKESTPFQSSGRSSHQTTTHPYLLRKSNKTPHQINTSSCTSVLRESRKWSPRGVAQHLAQSGHCLTDEG